jgi:hypothetical protein
VGWRKSDVAVSDSDETAKDVFGKGY